MLLNHTSILLVGLALSVPYLQECECELDPIEPVGECKPQEDEHECRICLRTACCEGLTVCEADADCSCVAECLANPGELGMDACAETACGVDDVTAALEPLHRYCEVEEECGSKRYCRGVSEPPQ